MLGVFMPSPYTSRESHEDTQELARRLGIELKTLPITPPFKSYLQTLKPVVCRGPTLIRRKRICKRASAAIC